MDFGWLLVVGGHVIAQPGTFTSAGIFHKLAGTFHKVAAYFHKLACNSQSSMIAPVLRALPAVTKVDG